MRNMFDELGEVIGEVIGFLIALPLIYLALQFAGSIFDIMVVLFV